MLIFAVLMVTTGCLSVVAYAVRVGDARTVYAVAAALGAVAAVVTAVVSVR